VSAGQDIEPKGRNLGLKAIAAAVLCHPLAGRLLGLVYGNRIPHRGARIRVLPGGDPRLNAYLYWGIYESAEIRYIDQFVTPGMDVVELGASIGGVSCSIAQRIGAKDKLVCVEANPDIIGILRENLDRNSPGRDVRIFQGAISYAGSETVEFALGDSTLSSHIGSGATTRSVPALTLSQLLQREAVGDYALVCDIEGAEAELFNGEREAFAHCRVIVIELHTTKYQGVDYSINDLIALILRTTGMKLAARYGEVCAFARA
jgi:FkbM family methyltransferase